jgi:hypothetical protein
MTQNPAEAEQMHEQTLSFGCDAEVRVLRELEWASV